VTPTPFLRAIREAAPNTFLTVGSGINDPELASEEGAIAHGFQALADGADAVYTGLSCERIRAMSREKIPCIGHVGYVPYRSSWYGGARAIGKKADEAIQVYRDTLAYQEAGAIAVEMEIVPHRIATEIAKRVDILIISMGSGVGGDVQYLFAEDVLGTNTGHVPRHAKVYADLHGELQRVQQIRIDAFAALQQEVASGAYPESKHLIGVDDQEFDAFLSGIDAS
ncbi:MAG: 3-methyl-2-oxobutanoate hydroxymethyltransferase, partial [Verrucomicrobia bacterium]